ncbi:hypothetical protein M427DRAFT_359830 [Gonapodya prolifera JEL478]|uniref:SH3 domain-containing protein n=1 Tax=Gonapodya prolifera (strain JEL478) TaxID=1344416 RepID=A0A139AB68_GONPJ|nr:hypothetical protein M427DRAFT_359830 [Gonapodya prolifera JEL478]|eukprot:KXS13914.1 hypothetical protein M427DRAFT_359830 [Gonapodya prolifera JEL478]
MYSISTPAYQTSLGSQPQSYYQHLQTMPNMPMQPPNALHTGPFQPQRFIGPPSVSNMNSAALAPSDVLQRMSNSAALDPSQDEGFSRMANVGSLTSGVRATEPTSQAYSQSTTSSTPIHWTFAYFAGAAFSGNDQIVLPEPQPAFVVLRDYVARNDDELTVAAGNHVQLYTAYRDGWGLVGVAGMEHVGLLPM